MMTCNKCKKKTYVIHITRNHRHLCADCYDKVRDKSNNSTGIDQTIYKREK